MKHCATKKEFLLNCEVEERLNESAERLDYALIDELNEVMHDKIKEFLLNCKVESRLSESTEIVCHVLIDKSKEASCDEIK